MNHPNSIKPSASFACRDSLQTLPVRLQEAAANRLGHAEFLETHLPG